MALFADKTKVPVAQSRAEIERLLEKHKAKQYGTAVDYELLRARVQFRLHDRVVRFVIVLPDPAKLRSDRFAQAERQRWRALLLVLKAKLESVENNIETFEESFLSQIVMPNDQTVSEMAKPVIAEAYKTGRMKALGPATTTSDAKLD
jgi:hypothetical protein